MSNRGLQIIDYFTDKFLFFLVRFGYFIHQGEYLLGKAVDVSLVALF